MNVYAAGHRVAIVLLYSAEPKNACDNWVTSGSIRANYFTRAASALEDSAYRSVTSNFLSNFQSAERGSIRSVPASDTEFGGGDRVGLHGLTVLHQKYFLVANTHQYFVPLAVI